MNFSSNSQHSDEQELDINITPLIDIIFLLLIFFMLTTTFDNKQKISVNLPSASKKQQTQTKDKATEITITSDSTIYVESKKLKLKELEELLKKTVSNNSESAVIVRADGEVKHAKIVEILDLAKRQKIKSISIAVKPK